VSGLLVVSCSASQSSDGTMLYGMVLGVIMELLMLIKLEEFLCCKWFINTSLHGNIQVVRYGTVLMRQSQRTFCGDVSVLIAGLATNYYKPSNFMAQASGGLSTCKMSFCWL